MNKKELIALLKEVKDCKEENACEYFKKRLEEMGYENFENIAARENISVDLRDLYAAEQERTRWYTSRDRNNCVNGTINRNVKGAEGYEFIVVNGNYKRVDIMKREFTHMAIEIMAKKIG